MLGRLHYSAFPSLKSSCRLFLRFSVYRIYLDSRLQSPGGVLEPGRLYVRSDQQDQVMLHFTPAQSIKRSRLIPFGVLPLNRSGTLTGAKRVAGGLITPPVPPGPQPCESLTLSSSPPLLARHPSPRHRSSLPVMRGFAPSVRLGVLCAVFMARRALAVFLTNSPMDPEAGELYEITWTNAEGPVTHYLVTISSSGEIAPVLEIAGMLLLRNHLSALYLEPPAQRSRMHTHKWTFSLDNLDPADESYTWEVPEDLAPGDDYSMGITSNEDSSFSVPFALEGTGVSCLRTRALDTTQNHRHGQSDG